MNYPTEAREPSALMWTIGHYRALFREGEVSRSAAMQQMDGVRELVELADSYVLNEVTLIAGKGRLDPPAVVEFFNTDAGAVRRVDEAKVDRYRESLGILNAEREMWDEDDAHAAFVKTLDYDEADRVSAEYDQKWRRKFDEVNTLYALRRLRKAFSLDCATFGLVMRHASIDPPSRPSSTRLRP